MNVNSDEGVDTLAEPIAVTAPPARGKRKSGSVPQAAPKREAWDQQPNENDLWFIRFLRYVAVGPGRSVSIVATGKRNSYPVPAHWPVQAKQMNWRVRAVAFDDAAWRNPALVDTFNDTLTAFLPNARNGKEAEKLAETIAAGGYQVPPPREDDPNWTGEPNPRHLED